MSAIKQCDRCKEAYDPFDISENSFYNDESWRYRVVKDCYPYSEHKIDLCLKCVILKVMVVKVVLLKMLKNGKCHVVSVQEVVKIIGEVNQRSE